MDLRLEKASLIRELEQVNDVSVIRVLKSVLHLGLKSEGRVTSDEYNKDLDQADAEIGAGDFLVHEEALKEIRSWCDK